MSPRFLSLARALQLPIVLLLLALALPGQAATVFCVGTAQQLTDALASAAASPDPTIDIRLRSGTYTGSFDLSAQHSNQSIQLSGGWVSFLNTPCSLQFKGTSGTTLVGPASNGTLLVEVSNAASGSTVTVSDLTVSNPNFSDIAWGACLYAGNTAGNTMLLERLRMEQCHSTLGPYASGFLTNSGGTLTLRNVVTVDGAAPENGGLRVATYSAGTSYLSHISITNTQSNNTISGLYITADANSTAYLSNSVIWGNNPGPDTYDVYVDGPNIHFLRVHYGSLAGIPASNDTPGMGDPGFLGVNDPHLSANSVLIDSAVANPAGGAGTLDAAGQPRTSGVASDVGAYEVEYLFRNGFEAPP